MQYCLPKSFLETSGQEASAFLPSVWMGIQFRFKVQANTSAVAWRWDCCAPCEASGGDWIHPCAQGRQQLCIHYSEPLILWNLLALSEPGGTAENFSGGGRGIKETTVKEGRLVLSWFSELNCLAGTVLSARAHWKEEVLCKVEIWGTEPHPWQQQAVRLAAIFHFWLSALSPTRSLPSLLQHTLSHLNLPFASSSVSSRVSLHLSPVVFPYHLLLSSSSCGPYMPIQNHGTFSWG